MQSEFAFSESFCFLAWISRESPYSRSFRTISQVLHALIMVGLLAKDRFP